MVEPYGKNFRYKNPEKGNTLFRNFFDVFCLLLSFCSGSLGSAP